MKLSKLKSIKEANTLSEQEELSIDATCIQDLRRKFVTKTLKAFFADQIRFIESNVKLKTCFGSRAERLLNTSRSFTRG